MRILISLAEPLPPQASGGSQKVAAELTNLLVRDGEHVALAGRLIPRQRSGLAPAMRALRTGKLFYRERGPFDRFRFFRGCKGFAQVLDAFVPDVVVMNTMSAMPMANLVAALEIPLVLYWHDVEFHKLEGVPPEGAVHVANSRFTAMRLEQRFGLSASVIPPLFSRIGDDALGKATHDRMLFINPVAEKGLDRVIEIARACPDLIVEIVESWAMNRQEGKALRRRLAALPNVLLTSQQRDMAPVYRRAWLLLAPSRWEEAWGRVASEAQGFDVPVLATRIGGLPESVDAGGLLFSPNAGLAAWTDSIRRLRDDRRAYDELVRVTRGVAGRPELDPRRNIQLLRDVVLRSCLPVQSKS